MESSSYIVWIKRFIPLVVILAVWIGWDGYKQYRLDEQVALDTKIASVTAYLYVGSARYRGDSLRYIDYRDSLLEANDLSEELMHEYANSEDTRSSSYKRYVKILGEVIDSLYRHEDSARKYPDSVLNSL